MRAWLTLWSLGLVIALVACGGGKRRTPVSDRASDAAPTAGKAALMNMVPRAFFVAPDAGANISVDHPVVFEFGVEHYEIAAVPEEVEQPRPDVGHDHLGVKESLGVHALVSLVAAERSKIGHVLYCKQKACRMASRVATPMSLEGASERSL